MWALKTDLIAIKIKEEQNEILNALHTINKTNTHPIVNRL